MTDHRRIAGWLNDLATITAGTAPLADAKAKIAALSALLIDEFPEAAFCKQSLVHVAASCKFFPTFSELRDALTAWWRENKPTKAIEGPQSEWTDDERNYLAAWHRRRAGGKYPIEDLPRSLDTMRSI